MSDSPVVGWGVLLMGHQFDLEDWEEALKPEFDPWVERDTTAADGSRFILRSRALDELKTGTEVKERAEQLAAQLNGAMMLSRSTDPVKLDDPVSYHEDGSTKRHVFFQAENMTSRARISSSFVVSSPDGRPTPPPPPSPSEVQRWSQLTERDDLLADALIHFARADNWYDLYKTFEIICKGVRGGENGLRNKGWTTRAETKPFGETCDYYRHARRRRPDVIMTVPEARNYLRRLLRHWVDTRRPVP